LRLLGRAAPPRGHRAQERERRHRRPFACAGSSVSYSNQGSFLRTPERSAHARPPCPEPKSKATYERRNTHKNSDPKSSSQTPRNNHQNPTPRQSPRHRTHPRPTTHTNRYTAATCHCRLGLERPDGRHPPTRRPRVRRRGSGSRPRAEQAPAQPRPAGENHKPDNTLPSGVRATAERAVAHAKSRHTPSEEERRHHRAHQPMKAHEGP
jgi:hypothetical protein